MKFHSRWAATALFAVAFLLSGCGGGGGGGSSAAPAPAPTPTPTPTTTAFTLSRAATFTSGHTSTVHLSGSDTTGDKYTATLSSTTQAQTIFNGQPAIPFQVIVNLTDTTTNFFSTSTGFGYYSTDIANLMYLGYTDSFGSIYTPISLNVLPQTATIGASGVIGTYSGSGAAAGKTLIGTWELTNANNGLANLVITQSINIGPTLEVSTKTTTVIDQQGNPQSTTLVIYIGSNGVTLTMSGN